MSTQPLSNDETKALLEEIFMEPSNIVKVDRFVADNQAAPCNGVCEPGKCM